MYLGVDVGSISTDAVLINENDEILSYSIVKSGFDHKQAIEKAISKVFRKSGIHEGEVEAIVSTGYGRRNVAEAFRSVTEISCHAMGIHRIFPEVRTVIDIGGQDSKVILVSEEGFAESFIMNDKCAAGTGRFLEVMAHSIGVGIRELGTLSLAAKKILKISNICTVFAESEVISRIAEGKPKEEIIAGIHQAIGERLVGMISAVGIKRPIALTGGVAKNRGVVNALSRRIGNSISIPSEPQIVGALGAAIYSKHFSKKLVH